MTWETVLDALASETGLTCLKALLGGVLGFAGGLGVYALIVATKRVAGGLARAGGWLLRAAFPPRPPEPPPKPLAEEVAMLVEAITADSRMDGGWVVTGHTRVATAGQTVSLRVGEGGGVTTAAPGSVWSHGDDVTRHFTPDELAVIRRAAAARLAWFDACEREAARHRAACGAA